MIKNLQKQVKLVRKTWDKKKWKFGKQFGVFKSNRLERALSNKRLPNGKKSDKEIYQNAKICYKRGKHGRRLREKTSEKSSMKSEKTYQNAQICYETWDMREDSVRKLPGSLPWS